MKYLGIKLQKVCKSYIINSIKLVRKIKGDQLDARYALLMDLKYL